MNHVKTLHKTSVLGPWPSRQGRLRSSVHNYIALTKPTIVLTFALTGAAAMVMEGSLLANPLNFFLVLLAITFTAASANGLNQYFERDIDSRMERTRLRRPLPLKSMEPRNALFFSIALGVLAIGYLFLSVHIVSALYALGTILFYSLFYTLWLKPRTPYNIVIGGAAGATAPLIAWSAATGHTPLAPWLLFLIIFIWTPPHFWALALCVKDQYAKVGLPMLPVIKGEERTLKEIGWYSVALFFSTLLPIFFNILGRVYASASLVLGLLFLFYAGRLYRKKSVKTAYQLFGYSIIYLILLFIFIILDVQV